jgi:hypothetical protein
MLKNYKLQIFTTKIHTFFEKTKTIYRKNRHVEKKYFLVGYFHPPMHLATASAACGPGYVAFPW